MTAPPRTARTMRIAIDPAQIEVLITELQRGHDEAWKLWKRIRTRTAGYQHLAVLERQIPAMRGVRASLESDAWQHLGAAMRGLQADVAEAKLMHQRALTADGGAARSLTAAAVKPRKVHRPKLAIDARGTLLGWRNGRRRTAPLQLGVIHSTESGDARGNGDLNGVLNWWRDQRSEGSAHMVVDAEGKSAYAVDVKNRAPHVGTMNYNSVGIEMIGRASFSGGKWSGRKAQMHQVARWMAWVSQTQGLPLRRAVVSSNGTMVRTGWLMHRDLRGLGTNHTDPGPEFPFDDLLGMAAWYKRNGWVQ